MPYINEEKREVLDPVIEELIQAFRGLQSDDPNDNTEANLNYVLSRLLDHMYTSNYQEMNNALGMLLAVALEYYRRVAAPYENQKRHDEGDVYSVDRPAGSKIHRAIEQYVTSNADE